LLQTLNKGRGVQSIEVGIRVLHALADAAGPLKLKDVAKAANVAPAQAHAYLMSFRRQNLVEQDEATGLYRLGHFALQLGIARMRSFDPVRTGSDAILDLADQTRMTAALSVWGSFGPTVIYIHEGADQIHINTRAGTIYSLTGTATGLVFAAYLPEDLVKAAIRAQMLETKTTQRVGARVEFQAIARQLELIRELGYGTIDAPPIPGINAIAAPVFDDVDQIRMVITLIGHSESIDVKPRSKHVQLVMQSAQRLNWQMGHFGGGLRATGRTAVPGDATSIERRSLVGKGRTSRKLLPAHE
jgi:DNA-binding IclR family transcriptional regulator